MATPANATVTAESNIKCPYCAEVIAAAAKKCKHWGEFLDETLRYAWMLTPRSTGLAVAPNGKTKVAAGLFAIFLGGIGMHKFYLGQVGQGIVYVLFCWTFIPSVIGLIEGVIYLMMSDQAFAEKYGMALRSNEAKPLAPQPARPCSVRPTETCLVQGGSRLEPHDNSNYSGKREEAAMKIAIISFLVLLFPTSSVFGQSVADVARQNRPKDAKVTSQRVFTDDDVKHTTSTFTLQKAPTTISVEDLERKVDEVESKTPRQLGEEFVKDIQFPGRDRWEQDLYNQKEALVAATRNWIILKRSDKSTKDTLDRAAGDQDVANRAYTDLQAKGIVEAAKWEKR